MVDAMPRRHLTHLQNALGLAPSAASRSGRRLVTTRLGARARRLDADTAHDMAVLLTTPVFAQLNDLADNPSAPSEATLALLVERWGLRIVVLALHAMFEAGDLGPSELEHLCRLVEQGSTGLPQAASQHIEVTRPEATPFGLMRIVRNALVQAEVEDARNVMADVEAAIDYLTRREPQSPTWHYLHQFMHEPSNENLALDNLDTDFDLMTLVAQMERLATREPSKLRPALALLPATVAIRLASMQEADWLVPTLIDSALAEPPRLQALLGVIPEPFKGWTSFVDTIVHGATGAASDLLKTEAAVVALEHAVARWADKGRADAPSTISSLTLAHVRCRRLRSDFAGARRLLDDVDVFAMTPAQRGALALEQALAISEIRGLEAIEFPRSEADMVRIKQRLMPVRRLLSTAIELDPANALAHALLGLLLHCEEDSGAAAHLGSALSLLEQTHTDLHALAELRFATGLARLRLLEPDIAFSAYSEMSSSLRSGYSPSSVDAVSAIHALGAHDSPYLAEFLTHVRELIPHEPEMVAVVHDRASRGDPPCVDLAEELGADVRVPASRRAALLIAALAGVEVTADTDRAERFVYALDDVLIRAASPILDGQFAEKLASLDVIRLALGHAVDALRIEVLRRIGRLDEARAVARQLFFRAVSGALPPEYDADDLLLLLQELGLEEDELTELRRVASKRLADSYSSTERREEEVRVIFVGGNETQQRYVTSVEHELGDRFGSHVTVDWFLTGWRSTWSRELNDILVAMVDADAVVIMTFVRTHLGQRVRKAAGEHGLPWVACTGHGRTSMIRAIERAVRLAHGSDQPARGDRPSSGS